MILALCSIVYQRKKSLSYLQKMEQSKSKPCNLDSNSVLSGNLKSSTNKYSRNTNNSLFVHDIFSEDFQKRACGNCTRKTPDLPIGSQPLLDPHCGWDAQSLVGINLASDPHHYWPALTVITTSYVFIVILGDPLIMVVDSTGPRLKMCDKYYVWGI